MEKEVQDQITVNRMILLRPMMIGSVRKFPLSLMNRRIASVMRAK